MSNNNFSRRRRGMRFRPKGGLGQSPQKPDREATEARAEVVSEQGGNERLFEKRHSQEIERAENIAAGLPAEGVAEPQTPAHIPEKKDFRDPHLDTPAQVQEEKIPTREEGGGPAQGLDRCHQISGGEHR